MIVTLLLTFFSLILLYYYIIHLSRKGRLINNFPGYTPIPIFGNTLKVCWLSPRDLWLFMRNMLTIYYPICKFWFFTNPAILIRHPDHIEKILNNTKHIEKSYIYNSFRPWLGEGLLISKGSKWHKRRKILTSSFHFSILKEFVDVFIEEGNYIVKSFNHVEESVIEDLLSFTSYHTLNAICETSMGISLKDINDIDQQQYRKAIYGMTDIIITRLFKPWLLIDTLFNFTSLHNMQNKYLNILHSFTENIIAKRKRYHEQTGGQYLKYLENNAETEDTEVIGVKRKRMAMLDILIAESLDNGLTNMDIREEVDTFMFEGHDTVAISFFFSLLLLAEHKDIQNRVREEIYEVTQENDGKFTMNALQNLSYLERCLKESLRMYPSVPVISRICAEDIPLQPYIIPEDTTAHIFIYDLHHDSNFWPNPEVFDPDRFLPENIQKRHPYSYLPFSAGARNCIGQRFAMLELKALVGSMVYNFYLEPIDYLRDVEFKKDIILRTAQPVGLKVISIKRT